MPSKTNKETAPAAPALKEVEFGAEGSIAGFATAPIIVFNLGEIREDAIAVFKQRLERTAMLLVRDLNKSYDQPDGVPQLVGYDVPALGGVVGAWTIKPRDAAKPAAIRTYDEYVSARRDAANKVAAKRKPAAAELDVE